MGKYITKEGLEKLKKELDELKGSKRKEIAERLKIAISYGDLSENFDYSDAKEQQALLEARINELEQEIRESKIVEDREKTDSVQVGANVEVDIAGSKMNLEIVTAQEADPASGKISAESPIGSALMGKKKGESVEVQTPNGTTTYKITNVS